LKPHTGFEPDLAAALPIEERIAIQELAHLYALYCDTRHFERLADLFAQECLYDEAVVGGRPAKSRDEVLALFRAASAKLGPMIHICTNHIISAFSGDCASGLCHVLAEGIFNIEGGQQPFRIFGYYDDQYTKVGGRWRFKSRVLRLLVPSQGAPTLDDLTHDVIFQHRDVQ
jgi:hypothetical protein